MWRKLSQSLLSGKGSSSQLALPSGWRHYQTAISGSSTPQQPCLHRKLVPTRLTAPSFAAPLSYLSIPQSENNRKLQQTGIRSIPSYFSRVALMIVFTPILPHFDLEHTICSYISYRKRGWCAITTAGQRMHPPQANAANPTAPLPQVSTGVHSSGERPTPTPAHYVLVSSQ